MDLKSEDLFISDDVENKYYIYSNISNLPDSLIDDFENPEKWEVVKSCQKGYVKVSILRKLNYLDDN